MGLLDDAIREHLELKRRRGADPAEVEKQEREALGPIGAAAPVEGGGVAVDEPPPADLHEDDEPDDGVAYDDDRVPLDDERDALRPHDDFDPDPFEDAHAALPPEPSGAVRAPDPPRDDPPPPVSQPTEQYSVDDLEELRRPEDEEERDAVPADEGPRDVVPADEGPEEGEDVLDETPEFLQEAPEHDRLWFEQRPPRDFDF
jgi:hypothetical protein